MIKPLGDVCLQIAKYAEQGNHDLLSYILKLAAAEAYNIVDAHPNWGQVTPNDLRSGVFDLDIASDVVFSDAICAEFFGVAGRKSARGVANSLFIEALHPEDKPKVLAQVEASIKTKTVFHSEYRLIAKNEIRHIRARGFCALDRSGRPSRLAGTVMDVTALQLCSADDILRH